MAAPARLRTASKRASARVRCTASPGAFSPAMTRRKGSGSRSVSAMMSVMGGMSGQSGGAWESVPQNKGATNTSSGGMGRAAGPLADPPIQGRGASTKGCYLATREGGVGPPPPSVFFRKSNGGGAGPTGRQPEARAAPDLKSLDKRERK